MDVGLQSYYAVGAGAILALAAALSLPRRRVVVLIVLAAVVAGTWFLPLPYRQEQGGGPFYFGDYSTYLESFDDYAGQRAVRFQNHLGSVLIGQLAKAAGPGSGQERRAFLLLSLVAACLFAGELLLVCRAAKWSSRALRYAALCLAAPVSLMVWGYREFGPLALCASCFPLAAMVHARDEGSDHAYAGIGALVGLRSALHGFGFLSLAGLLLGYLSGGRRGVRPAVVTVVVALAASLVWLAYYLIVLHIQVEPGHASSLPMRHLLTAYEARGRVVEPFVSIAAARDLLATSVMVGVPLWLASLAHVWQRAAARRFLLAFSAPSVVLLLCFWPVQGVGPELDLLFAAFPAFFAAAWYASKHSGLTWVGVVLGMIGHVLAWSVGGSDLFVNARP